MTPDVFKPVFERQYMSLTSSGGLLKAGVYALMEDNEDLWWYYNTSLEGYNNLFESVLQGNTLQSLTQKIVQKKGRFIGLDLCGQGDFLLELDVTHGLSVCLHHDYQRCNRPSKTIQKYNGNLMFNETWERIDDWIKNHGNPDLIICAPGGAAEPLWDWGKPKNLNYPYSRVSFIFHLNKMFDILSESGSLFVEFQSSGTLRRWISSLDEKLFKHFPENTLAVLDKESHVLRISKISDSSQQTTPPSKKIIILNQTLD